MLYRAPNNAQHYPPGPSYIDSASNPPLAAIAGNSIYSAAASSSFYSAPAGSSSNMSNQHPQTQQQNSLIDFSGSIPQGTVVQQPDVSFHPSSQQVLESTSGQNLVANGGGADRIEEEVEQ